MNPRSSAAQYYAAASFGTPKESAEERMIRELLAAGSSEVEQRVARTVKQWNTIVRDYLRIETGLRLSVGDDQQSVPLRIRGGLPPPFRELVARHPNPLLWWLNLNRAAFESTSKGLALLQPRVADILDHSSFSDCEATQSDIDHSIDFVQRLLAALDEDDHRKEIAEIETDVLGAYFFNVPEIQLYWMVIAVVAGMLGVSIEALTAVVLAHELSHAYTHLGRDIDGQRWSTLAFADTELDIVEGLAQFYTETICRKLEQRFPDAMTAFTALLTLQSGPYVVYKNWLQKDENRGEIVRSAMVAIRLRGTTGYEGFIHEINNGRARMADRVRRTASQ